MVELASVEIHQAISQGGSQSSDTLTFGQGTNAAIKGAALSIHSLFIEQALANPKSMKAKMVLKLIK